ncbi:MAG: diguanylate cyclase [Cyanobium sp.]
MEYFADHDPLTSLLNQRRFRIDVDRQLAYGRRHGDGGALIMLDLDHFKQINDHYGHAVGDEVIIAVASALRSCSRETDVVARLGGDEVAVLLPEASLVDARHHAQKLIATIHDLKTDSAAAGIQVAASAGLAGFSAHDGQCADDVLINADLALYQAKAAGRGKVEVFADSTGLHEKLEARLLWSVRIREALAHNGFVIHAKPVVDLENDAVMSYELLIRLKALGEILIPPSVFLYTAERFGMAVDIDEWLTAQAIAILEPLPPQDRLPLGLNISGSALLGDRFINFVRHGLQRSGLSPSLLIFELNGAIAMANREQAKQIGRSLAALGCLLALDDFGTAFGTAFGRFYHLKHLPVDILKLDGAYIRGLGTQLDHTDRLTHRGGGAARQGAGHQGGGLLCRRSGDPARAAADGRPLRPGGLPRGPLGCGGDPGAPGSAPAGATIRAPLPADQGQATKLSGS